MASWLTAGLTMTPAPTTWLVAGLILTPSGASPTLVVESNFINGLPGVMQDVALYSGIDVSGSAFINDYETAFWFQTEEFGASVGGPNAGRFNKVLEVAKINPATILEVPYPFLTLMYAETNPVTTTSALNYMQTQTETEPGIIFAGPDGMIHAYNREYQYQNTTTLVSQGIFGDTATSTYRFDGPSLVIAQDDLDTWNDVQVQSGRAGSALQEVGAAQSTVASESAAEFGSRTLQGLTSLQQQYDSDALATAQQYLAWYGTPVIRVTQMMLNAQGNNGNNIPQMLGRGIYDRITTQYQGQTAGTPFQQDSLVESIAHTVDMNGPTWNTTWQLSPYEITVTNPFYLDSSDMDGTAVLIL